MEATNSTERRECSEHTSMKTIGGEEGGDEMQRRRETKGSSKGKSCKGYLFYSSTLRSNNRNPRCIGIPRSLPHVPSHVGLDIETSKEGKALVDFYYACAGYSVYTTRTEASADSDRQGANIDLPACVGLELIVDKRPSSSGTASTPAPASVHAHNREDRESPQPQSHKPAQAVGNDFLNRFTRNANLVASGVARNMRKVGNYVKDNIDDILDPYRKRPR
ncbi:hypothetical protein SLE2022_360370 [Rubroshorea leprosula]